MTHVLIGKYIPDTAQIYFPWDDDLYTWFLQHGLGSGGNGGKALPLIYSDNCESTVKKPKLRRRYVLRPEMFSKTFKQLGWEETDKPNEPIISAEKPEIEVSVVRTKGDPQLNFKLIPKNQYHMEFSVMSAFGKLYSNWVTFYFTIKDFKDIVDKLKKALSQMKYKPIRACPTFGSEDKQNKREQFDYTILPVQSYVFSLGSFPNAIDYLKTNGFKGKVIPSLFFSCTEKACTQTMEPYIKLGILHTTGDEGFMKREPQFVLKIAQDKIITLKRGKKAKVKGLITTSPGLLNKNFFVVDAATFLQFAEELLNRDTRTKQTKLF